MKLAYVIPIIFVMVLWAICFPFINIGLPYASHLTFAALRAFIAGSVLLLVALVLRAPQPEGLKMWLLIVAIGFFATGLGFYGMFHASEYISPGIATVIANTQPLLATMLAAMYLNEHVNGLGKLGVVIGFFGIVLIALPSILNNNESGFGYGILFISIGVVGIAISNILIRYIAKKVDPLIAMGWQLVFGSFFLASLGLMVEDFGAVQWNVTFIMSLLILALPGTALVFWLWCRVLSSVELNQANAFNFLVPIFGLLFGVIFFQEGFGVFAIVGVVLTILGIILVNWPGNTSVSNLATELVKE
tara:strand:+ start:353 stop:1264 length:912 start_codon:yes stop_codon:yes gene_type:complete